MLKNKTWPLLQISIEISFAEQKIITSPLINIDDIKPSFEEFDTNTDSTNFQQSLKEKKSVKKLKSSQAILIGLDKITAKSSELIVNLNENKTFGPLEIKILKCGKVKVNNKIDSVAYMQVKDMTNEKMKNLSDMGVPKDFNLPM